MKRFSLILIFLILFSVFSTAVFADSQLDIGINLPLVVGIAFEGQTESEELPYTLPVIDLMYNYYLGEGPLQIGIGARVWTLFLVTGLYPIVSAELDLHPLVIQANFGGGMFAYTSIAGSGVEFGKVFLPELSVGVRLTKWFSIGGSVLGLWIPEVTGSAMGYTLNIFGRFRIN